MHHFFCLPFGSAGHQASGITLAESTKVLSHTLGFLITVWFSSTDLLNFRTSDSEVVSVALILALEVCFPRDVHFLL